MTTLSPNMAASGRNDSRLSWLSDDEWDLLIGHLSAFHAVSSFHGFRPGWVFKMGTLGLGYYIDKQPAELALLRLAATCHAIRARVLPRLLPLAAQKLQLAAATAPPASYVMGRFLVETALRDLRKQKGGMSSLPDIASFLEDEALVTAALAHGLHKAGFDIVAFARSSLVTAMHFARAAGVTSAHASLLKNPYDRAHYRVLAPPADAIELVQLIPASSNEIEPIAIRVSKALLLEAALKYASRPWNRSGVV